MTAPWTARPQSGDQFVRQTLGKMKDMARSVVAHPEVRAAAMRAVEYANPRDRTEQAYALRSWLADHIRFIRDPAGLELVQSPVTLLTKVRQDYYALGDCDDIATLGAAMGLSVGIPARFRALAFGGPFQHVVADLITPQIVDLDISRVSGAPNASRIMLMMV